MATSRSHRRPCVEPPRWCQVTLRSRLQRALDLVIDRAEVPGAAAALEVLLAVSSAYVTPRCVSGAAVAPRPYRLDRTTMTTTNDVAGGTSWTLRSEGSRYVLRYYRYDLGKARRVRRRLPRSFTKLMAIAYAQAGLATPAVVGDDSEGPNRRPRNAYVLDVESARRAATRAK